MTPTDELDEIRYPIGRVQIATNVTPSDRSRWIAQMSEAPAKLRAAVAGLTDQQLDRRYRDGGWTLRQVAHHLADEHLNAFGYFKKAVTEDDPPVNVYKEPGWVSGQWSVASGQWPVVSKISDCTQWNLSYSLATGHWSLVTDHWPLATG